MSSLFELGPSDPDPHLKRPTLFISRYNALLPFATTYEFKTLVDTERSE